MNGRSSRPGIREAIVTLVFCTLLGWTGWTGFFLMLAVFLHQGGPGFLFGIGGYPYLLFNVLSVFAGAILGVVLLRQGGISVPSASEMGATRGSLVGLAVGVVGFFFIGGSIGVLGTCVLWGLVIGRVFDRRGETTRVA